MLNLLWGVRAFYYEMDKNTDETIVEVNVITLNNGFVEKGDMVVNLNATPAIKGGMTNTLRMTHI